MPRVASVVFLLTSIVIGLGAFGHGSNVAGVEAELARFPTFNPDTARVLIVVWYFCSGGMLMFSAVCLWAWRRMRSGDLAASFLPLLVSGFYIVTGLATVWYTRLAFFWTFVVLGGVLLASTLALRRAHAS